MALVSLTYSTQDGIDYTGTYTVPGLVHAPNMTRYFAYHNLQTGCGEVGYSKGTKTDVDIAPVIAYGIQVVP